MGQVFRKELSFLFVSVIIPPSFVFVLICQLSLLNSEDTNIATKQSHSALCVKNAKQ